MILVGYKCQSMFTRSVFDADFISEPGLGRIQPYSDLAVKLQVMFCDVLVHGGDGL